MFEIFASTPEHLGLAAIAAHARRVEALGFDGLCVPDALHDGLLMASQALAATTKLRLATSVLVAFPRSPMNVALSAWDLQFLSGGRFELGLGTQVQQNVEERYAARWLPPARGMRDYVGALRAIFHSFRTREPLHYVGEYYQLTRLQPFFNPGPLDLIGGVDSVPVMLGAVGPRMLQLVGAVADGVHTHPTNSSPTYLREVILPQIALGAQQRPKHLAAPFVCATLLLATGVDTQAVEMERERYRKLLAFLFSTPAYWPSLELYGWRSVGEQLQQCAREKRWEAMASLLRDEILATFLLCASYDDLAAQLVQRYQGLVQRVILPLADDATQDAAMADVIAKLKRYPCDKAVLC